MFPILAARLLAPGIHEFVVQAPRVARKARPGHFVVIRVDEKGERIPLTLADWDAEAGTITLVVQEVGYSTRLMGQLAAGDALQDVLGPLGTAPPIEKVGTIIGVGGGVGVAPLYPRIRGYKQAGNRVVAIAGARSRDLLIMVDRLRECSDELHLATDDGSVGHHGFVSQVLEKLLDSGVRPAEVLAIGPVPMMRAVVEVTRPRGIPTTVSLNALMVDGTGMCGGCRVSVGGVTRFTCVDGPEFDGLQVDFAELQQRLQQYRSQEKLAADPAQRKEACRCLEQLTAPSFRG
ncbi:MAG: sulfide/dihydroorotate dehydrogenase-like FAD/NAD-binding protein [Firmicutes bacterium]|nr:sulfide/dihydroorotate dehydrogenase-like FAD/NAD-binding protein [Bacillota bacterium]